MSLHVNSADTLHDTHAVVETLYRFAAGIDLRDHALLSSAFTEDAISDFRPAGAKAGFEYPVLQGRDAIVEALSTSLSGLDTSHSFSNRGWWWTVIRRGWMCWSKRSTYRASTVHASI